MGEAPSLVNLCMHAIKEELVHGDEILPFIYELPSDLFDSLLMCLPPLALQKLQDIPSSYCNDLVSADNYVASRRKRKSSMNFNAAWKALYESRWPDIGPVNWLAKRGEMVCELTDDWQQMYWERHLQNCLDAAAEIALLPSFEGCISEIKISDAIMKYIGYWSHQIHPTCDYAKLSYHCTQFGLYARCLRLQNVLCVAETSHLLRCSKLEGLELRWIKSKEHVEGLCELLKQNGETLKSIEFTHCKLSSTFVDAICDSLYINGCLEHGIQHFSIKTSSFLETSSSPLPVGLASFLSGRSLSSLCFCYNHLRQSFAKMVLNTLLDASSNIAVLELSENNIAGWLSQYKWRSTNCSHLSFGIGKSLQSLRVLNLRSNNLQKDDADCLKYALVHMPNLETLDLSDNPIEDDGLKSLLPYFIEMAEKTSSFTDLRLENCELSCGGVSQLLRVLSTSKKPLSALSVGENDLGSKAGTPLGQFLCTGIQSLNIEDIGLGSSGFLDAQAEIIGESNLVSINISKNRGESGAAEFISRLILQAPELVSIKASFNFIPGRLLPVICSALKVAKGKLEHLDLTGNVLFDQPAAADASALAEFQVNGKPVVILPLFRAPAAPHDDDP